MGEKSRKKRAIREMVAQLNIYLELDFIAYEGTSEVSCIDARGNVDVSSNA